MEEARSLLEEGGRMIPGPWIRHSEYVAEAAGKIARAECEGMDEETAYILRPCFMTLEGDSESAIWAHVYYEAIRFLRGSLDMRKMLRGQRCPIHFNRKRMEDYIAEVLI